MGQMGTSVRGQQKGREEVVKLRSYFAEVLEISARGRAFCSYCKLSTAKSFWRIRFGTCGSG